MQGKAIDVNISGVPFIF